ncbi:hypothetical protein GGS21DRAFT_361202 [Xylaria nigripes]|nr:hypothetical protein GGS21DRAFT_361202 [Xylaria nigripes]
MTPPLNKIRQMLESHLRPNINAVDKLNSGESGTIIDQLSENVDFYIISEGTDLAHHVQGKEAVKAAFSDPSKPSMHKIIDHTKPMQFEVVHLIGSEESPLVAAVLRTVATTKAGKQLNHEYVVVMEFDRNDLISTLKTYPDSHHLLSHAADL